MRRTADEALRTRDAIVGAARGLFTAKGFADTSTTEVVEAAGVTRGALYHHFADKSALFLAVFTQIEHELDETVTAAALAGSGALDVFTRGCEALLDFVVRADYHQVVVVDGPAVLGSAAWHDIDQAVGLATMEAGLQVLDDAGLLRVPRSPALAVLAFGALTEAGIVLSRAAPGSPSRDELVADLLRLLTTAPSPPTGAKRSGRG
jgi:AcrR family transcriptional regulator